MISSIRSRTAVRCALALLLAACGAGHRLRPSPVAPFVTPTTELQSAPAAASAPASGNEPDSAARNATQPDVVQAKATPAPATPAPATPAPATPPAATPPSASQTSEAELRAELAQAAEPAHAALELVARLSQREQHAEALAVVDAARQRSRQPALLLQRAELLRDLGQRHVALAELRRLGERVGAEALPPSVRFDMAELEWLEGDRAAADATLQRLEADPSAAAWVAGAATMVAGLRRELASPAPTRLRLRDCFGNLRGGATPSIRLAMLRSLAQISPGGERAVRLRAIAIAAGDESAAVRSGAVQLAEPADELGAPFAAAALADSSPLVRRAAAAKVAALAPTEAPGLLAARLRLEDDELAFVAVHRALLAIDPTTPPLPLGAAGTAAGRAAFVAARERR